MVSAVQKNSLNLSVNICKFGRGVTVSEPDWLNTPTGFDLFVTDFKLNSVSRFRHPYIVFNFLQRSHSLACHIHFPATQI